MRQTSNVIVRSQQRASGRTAYRGAGCLVLLALVLAPWCRAQSTPPRPLREGIRIEYVLDLAPQSLRIAQDPVGGDLYYVTLDGGVHRIHGLETGTPQSEPIASAGDHGITRLQGMAFSGDALYLLGNVRAEEEKRTSGRLMRGRTDGRGRRVWSNVFTTEAFGISGTAFDHGFNGLAADPDGRYLYVNSGSRTDHGEVQDHGGTYPGAREVPLTAAVFRIPTDAHDLVLRNDLAELQEKGYLFARGIRNGFDLAFAPGGHLFLVSNSGDYDHPEDLFWLREGRHYGFPWVMGGVPNPQQDPAFRADPAEDPFLNPGSHAFLMGFFHNDPGFPPRPPDLEFTPPVANVGPDANYFRDPETGAVRKGDEAGVGVGTFTAHRSPLGLVFDRDSRLAPPYRGDGFVLSWTHGATSGLLGRLSALGSDLLHLRLSYHPAYDNYIVQAARIAEGFDGPVDAELVGTVLYVLEYGDPSRLWRLTFPTVSDP